jgi:hypothetical protein
MTFDEMIGNMEFCFWLDEDGKPCPRCKKLHNILLRCDDCGALFKPATGCACQA